MFSRRDFLKTAGGFAAAVTAGCGGGFFATPKAQTRPNILLIVADDMGYGDVSCFRGGQPWRPITPAPDNVEDIQTPNLDALAKKGMMLTDFHTNCSVCSPTRAALLTGRYNHRSGICNVLGQLGDAIKAVNKPGEEMFLGLKPDETTIAEILRKSGYRTGMFGKWHLGPMDTHHPMDQGFEVFVGTGGNAGDNFTMKLGPGDSGESYFYRGRKTVDAPGYWYTDVLADETIKFMTGRNSRPFFAYLPFTAPHNPYIGPNDKELADAWSGREDYGPGPREDKHQAYKEVVEGMDAAIGDILKALDKSGLAENTFIFFTSDNGPIEYGSTGPFRGRKTNLYEGGIRVPAIAAWEGKIPQGVKSSQLAMTMDITPTLAAIAGAQIPAGRKIDGINLTSVLAGGKSIDRGMLFWEKPVGVFMKNFDNRRWTVRDGDWTLVKENNQKDIALYNIADDPKQLRDLSAQYPDRVSKMTEAFKEWKKDVYSDSPWDINEYMKRFEQAGILEKQ
jgi:arylsulfatase A